MNGHYNEKVKVTAKLLHLPSNKESKLVEKLQTRYKFQPSDPIKRQNEFVKQCSTSQIRLSCCYFHITTVLSIHISPLAPGSNTEILAHSLGKIWIFYEPKTIRLWVYISLWRKKWRWRLCSTFKNIQWLYLFTKYKKCGLWVQLYLYLICIKWAVHPCTALRLCTGCTAHRGSRGIALLYLDQGTRTGWGVSIMPRKWAVAEV